MLIIKKFSLYNISLITLISMGFIWEIIGSSKYGKLIEMSNNVSFMTNLHITDWSICSNIDDDCRMVKYILPASEISLNSKNNENPSMMIESLSGYSYSKLFEDFIIKNRLIFSFYKDNNIIIIIIRPFKNPFSINFTNEVPSNDMDEILLTESLPVPMLLINNYLLPLGKDNKYAKSWPHANHINNESAEHIYCPAKMNLLLWTTSPSSLLVSLHHKVLFAGRQR